jgi:hypothetical protein
MNVGFEENDPVEYRKARSILKILKKYGADAWERKLPLIVVGCADGECTIFDGHHRHYAAILAGMRKIPVLVVNLETYYLLQERFDLPRIGMVEMLIEINPVMCRNYENGCT